jgi:hypothetical protein
VLEQLRARARPSIGIAFVGVGVMLAVVLATGGSDEPDPPPRAGGDAEPVRACERVEDTVTVRRRARAEAEFTAEEELSARETPPPWRSWLAARPGSPPQRPCGAPRRPRLERR